jgi:hypothetical protein
MHRGRSLRPGTCCSLREEGRIDRAAGRNGPVKPVSDGSGPFFVSPFLAAITTWMGWSVISLAGPRYWPLFVAREASREA